MQEIKDEELFKLIKGKRKEILTESIQLDGKEIKDENLLEIIQTIKSDQPSTISKAWTATSDFFSGTKRTEFSELEEFGYAEGSDAPTVGKAAKIATGMLLTPNVKTQMDIIKSQIPEVTFTQDKYNNIIVFMPDGKPFYLNKPGASTKDFVELTGQILQYIPGFSWAMKKAGKSYLKRVLFSGAAGGATSVVQDIGATTLGSKEGVDVPKLAISTVAPMVFEAAITPVVSALWKKIVGNSAYSKVIKKDGKDTYVLTKKGKEAAEAAGLDITKINSQTIKNFTTELTKGVDADVAAAQTAAGKFGFRLSASQAKGDAEGVATLIEASKGTFGKETQQLVVNFLKKQGIDIENTATNLISKFNRGQINFDSLDDVGQSIIQSLKGIYQKASDKATTAYNLVDKDAVFQAQNSNVDVLLASIQKTIKEGTDIIDKELTPLTIKGMNWVSQFVKNIKSKKIQNTNPTTLNAFETLRKKLNELIGDATSKVDKKNLIGMKQEFDKLYDDAIDNLLFSGRKEAVEAIKKARSLFKKREKLFAINPIRKGGLKIDDKAGKVIQKILNDPDVTPMKTIDWIFGTSGLGRKSEALSIIRRLKKIFNAEGKDLSKIAAVNKDFQSLRTGVFFKLVKDSIKNNKFSPEAFVKQWEGFLARDKALIKELFDDDEIKLVGEFVTQVRKTFKPKDLVNTSNTASALMRAINGVSRQLVGILGFKMASIQGLLAARTGFDRLRQLTSTKAAQKILDEELFGIGTGSQKSPLPVSSTMAFIQKYLGGKQNINVPYTPKGLID
tara:strand:+ start:1091 stop:3454 length:2364 start_codon:yes stop_codon:yes gene_type:complete